MANVVRNFNTNSKEDYRISEGKLEEFEAVGFYYVY
jgi:hypothetical protein